VILPDADMDMACRIIADAAFGCAGQRCLASSVAITVGDAAAPFSTKITESAAARTVGNGLDSGVEMGPVISSQSRVRIEGLIEQAVSGPARALIDGRGVHISGCEAGHFIKPTVLADVDPSSDLARTEVFGPVLSVIRAGSLEDAIEIVNRSAYGNMSCLFTSSGSAARQFRHEVRTGNVGINLGVAAPMAYFPFSGWKDSFFGDLHAQGSDAVDFFTEKKVIVERWPGDWTRKF
jgi:malonate-semialdehyde dehydrogenase (acetylating)/methylmalonate-semialdehyde dehydrogenase